MEITKEALNSSLTDLKNLEKSQNAQSVSEPLKKSAETPAEANVDKPEANQDLNKGGGGSHATEEGHGDMYKAHYMKKMMGENDHDYDERMKKMHDHDAMNKMGDHMSKMGDHGGDRSGAYGGPSKGYHGERAQMEGESDTDYAIRMKNMAGAGHEGDMSKMAYSHGNKEDEENDLLKSFQEDGQLKKAIDVSDFLKSLVEKTTHHLNAVDSRLEKSFSHLLETVETQNNVITNLVSQYEGLQKSFNEILAQPVGAPRSVGSGVAPISRMPGDLNKSQNVQNPMLLKKSILNKMCAAVERGEIRDHELIKFETTGEISNENLNRFGSQG